MNEQEHLDTLRKASVGLLRAKINQILNALGLSISDSSASLTSILVLSILAINVLFALNIALGLLLGEWLGSLGLGFLALSSIYLLLVLIYLCIQKKVEQRVQVRIARRVHYTVDNLNIKLNQVEGLRPVAPYREAFISGEPQPYLALALRRDEAKRQAKMAKGDLQEGVEYVRQNYGKLFGYVAQRQIPGVAYVAPFISMLSGSNRKKQEPTIPENKPKVISYIENKVTSLRPYIPYMVTAYNFLSPVVSSFVIGKTQGWLLGKLLGKKKRK